MQNAPICITSAAVFVSLKEWSTAPLQVRGGIMVVVHEDLDLLASGRVRHRSALPALAADDVGPDPAATLPDVIADLDADEVALARFPLYL
jgi:hypothetical protein